MQGLSTWFYYTVNTRLRDDLEGATPGPTNDRTARAKRQSQLQLRR